jgi:hypothetical protein
MAEEEGFRSIGQRDFSRDTCFLCRCELTQLNRTDEHVIPRWVQGCFDLWNDILELVNGMTIPYRQLTIPCCFTCNSSPRIPYNLRPEATSRINSTLVGVRHAPA